jgi:hAT family C-terminal dimerisation region
MYYCKDVYWVVETRKAEVTDKEDRWGGATMNWPKTNYAFTPVETEDKDGIRNGAIKGSIVRVGMIKKKRESLDPIARKLIERVKKEFLSYGAVASKDHLLAFACNPFTASVLMEDFEDFDVLLKDQSMVDEEKNLLNEIEQRTKDVLKKAIEELWGERLNNFSGQVDATGDTPSDDIEDQNSTDPFEKLRRKKRKKDESVNTEEDSVSKCIDDFFSQKFQVHQVISGQRSKVADAAKKVGSNRDQWLNNVELIASLFDVMEWWRNTGMTQYPLIYPVAMCILSLPDSNGHQERTFSAATWMDGNLVTMQKEVTFQIKVLLYKNEKFLDRYENKMKKRSKEDAEKRTKELLAKHIESKKEDEIDTENEQMMDMYEINGD